MRIASSTVFTNAVTAMNQQETIIAQDQQQVSTGRRINSPEDDPFASATSVTLNQQISRLSDFNQNRSLLSSNMTQMGSVLTSVTAALQSVSQSLVQAGSATLSVSDRQAIATALQGNLDTLVSYANTQDGNGNYLFSGFQTKTQPYVSGNFISSSATVSNAGNASITMTGQSLNNPFPGGAKITIQSYTPGQPATYTYDVTGLPTGDVTGATSVNGQMLIAGGNYNAALNLNGVPAVGDSFTLNPSPTLYQGDTGARTIEVNDNQYVGTTLAGPSIFESIPTGNGSFVTAANASNTGSGVIDPGSVTSLAALTRHQYAITFSGSPGEVTTGNQNTGSASYQQGSATGVPSTNDQYSVNFSVSGGQVQYTILDSSSGVTDPTTYSYSSGTPISLPNGTTFTLSGTPAPGDSFIYQPGPATTYSVQDLTTGTPVTGQTDVKFVAGNVIQFDGMSMTIKGSPSSNDTFTIDPPSTTTMFSVIQNAITALKTTGGKTPQSGAQLANALSAAQLGISGALAQVDMGQAVVGGRMNQLSALDSSTAMNKISLQKQLTTLTSTDMAAAISELSQATIALTASQKAFVQVQGLNLFSFIQ